jgi:hypothetical protein
LKNFFNFFLRPPFQALHPQRTERVVLREKPDRSTTFFSRHRGPSRFQSRFQNSICSFHATSEPFPQKPIGPRALTMFSCDFHPASPPWGRS